MKSTEHKGKLILKVVSNHSELECESESGNDKKMTICCLNNMNIIESESGNRTLPQNRQCRLSCRDGSRGLPQSTSPPLACAEPTNMNYHDLSAIFRSLPSTYFQYSSSSIFLINAKAELRIVKYLNI